VHPDRVCAIRQPGLVISRTAPVDLAIARLAERQHGNVALRQLTALGLSRQAVALRVRKGRLHRVHAGVFAVGHALLTSHGRWMAAVLACGESAVLSHGSAANLWGIRDTARAKIDVTTPLPTGHRRPGIASHRSRVLTPADVTAEDGIPCTTVARTLADIAGRLGDAGIRSAIHRAEKLRLFDGAEVYGVLDRLPNRRGAGRLRAILDRWGAVDSLTRSDLELIFLDLCRAAGIPLPRVNEDVEGLKCDFVWWAQRLIIETDGGDHATRITRARDAHRHQALTLAGWRVVHFTWGQVVHDPHVTAATVRGLLGIA
jgi:predicted transcriptional regulator of viral defense system